MAPHPDGLRRGARGEAAASGLLVGYVERLQQARQQAGSGDQRRVQDVDDYGYDAEYGIGGDACIHNMARYVAVAPRDVSTSLRYLDFETRATVPKRPNQGQYPMTSRASLRADMRHASGWYAVLPEPPPANRLKGDQTADWVVVGAGITGLAAARRIGELAPHARVLLLDEYRVGYGTSGRNSGFVIDTPHLSENLSEEDNRRVSRLVIAGLADLEGHVQEHGIDCEWSPRGHLTAVVNPRREKKLHATARMLDAADEEYEWYDRKTMARVTGTDYYHGAILTPRTVLVNPAALCRGLGETLPANVEVCEQTPVRRIEPGSPVKIECAEASISARNVLLTTNAFIARLGFLRRDVFPLIACASLSRPLADHEQAAMGGESEWGITGITTMRRTLSNRILVRHGLDYTSEFRLSESRRRQLLESHKVILKKRYPMLANLDFEHTWAGVFCMTRNWASRFGRLEPGVFVSLGYCGVGLPRGTISGRLLAEYAMGSESDLISDVQALSQPRPLPPPTVSRDRNSSKTGMVPMEQPGRGVGTVCRSAPRRRAAKRIAQQG